MDSQSWLTERFEEKRPLLRGGCASTAPRRPPSRTWAAGSPRSSRGSAWTCSARGKSRRERPIDAQVAERSTARGERPDPEAEAVLADSVGVALLVVLDALTPAERLAFVLHDLFALPFDEVAPHGMVGGAAKQLASRAAVAARAVGAIGREAVEREVVEAFHAGGARGRPRGPAGVLIRRPSFTSTARPHWREGSADAADTPREIRGASTGQQLIAPRAVSDRGRWGTHRRARRSDRRAGGCLSRVLVLTFANARTTRWRPSATVIAFARSISAVLKRAPIGRVRDRPPQAIDKCAP